VALSATSAGTSDPRALGRAAKVTTTAAVASSVCLIISATTWSFAFLDAAWVLLRA
jgi:hypothetical protein